MRRSQSVSKVRKILLKSVDDTQNCIFLCAYSNDLSILNVHMYIQRLLHPNIDAIAGAGDVVVAAEGKGPLDDRGEYGGNRRRWGITVLQLWMVMRSPSSQTTSSRGKSNSYVSRYLHTNKLF